MSTEKSHRITTKQLKAELDDLKSTVQISQGKFRIEHISTIIIAITTTVYCITTIGILLQMQKDNRLQKDYYQKTVRPFVYARTIELEHAQQPFRESSKLKIRYTLENVGTLPAMDLHHKIIYEEQVLDSFKKLDVSRVQWNEDDTWTSSGLYPNEKIYGFLYDINRQIRVEELQKYKWAHILVTYKDAGGKSYFYKWIVELRSAWNKTEISINPINKWSDFN